MRTPGRKQLDTGLRPPGASFLLSSISIAGAQQALATWAMAAAQVRVRDGMPCRVLVGQPQAEGDQNKPPRAGFSASCLSAPLSCWLCAGMHWHCAALKTVNADCVHPAPTAPEVLGPWPSRMDGTVTLVSP